MAAELAIRYRVTGMDCAKCAAKIEAAARRLPGVDHVEVSTTSQLMTLKVENPVAQLPRLEQTITDLGYRLDRVEAGRPDTKPPHMTSAYRGALWIVVLLNLGYGVAEMIGGLLAGSQAVKADALDFLGDGFITLLGIVAIGWSLGWRAKAAMIQGVFLGLLGIGVLINTVYRVIVTQTPEAELMGWLGAIALVVNIAAALVLLPHRTGDANLRAVWLFSRNDAIGNVAVVAAAGLVAWTASAWPDLVVAVVIAGLFLQSALRIIADANTELHEASAHNELRAKQRT